MVWRLDGYLCCLVIGTIVLIVLLPYITRLRSRCYLLVFAFLCLCCLCFTVGFWGGLFMVFCCGFVVTCWCLVGFGCWFVAVVGV